MLLARQGYSVTLLERYDFPRSKPCGDCLSPAANHVLQRIGVWEDVLRAGPARLAGWRLVAPDGSSFTGRFDRITSDARAASALAITRHRFDAVLLEHARAAGVVVQHGVTVTGLLHDHPGAVTGVRGRDSNGMLELRARLTIGADGLRSTIARRMNAYQRRPRVHKTSFTMHLQLPQAGSEGAMYVGHNSCLGIAPVEEGVGKCLHNVTLVLSRGAYDKHAGPREIFRRGLAQFDFDADIPGPARLLTSGPFDWPVRKTAFPGAVLVGDAAGYYDPFTGQGIYQALATAELLSLHAGEALRQPHNPAIELSAFAREQCKVTAGARRLQHIIEFVCAHPRLANRVFSKFAREPVVASALIGVTGDLLPPRSLLSPLLWARLAA